MPAEHDPHPGFFNKKNDSFRYYDDIKLQRSYFKMKLAMNLAYNTYRLNHRVVMALDEGVSIDTYLVLILFLLNRNLIELEVEHEDLTFCIEDSSRLHDSMIFKTVKDREGVETSGYVFKQTCDFYGLNLNEMGRHYGGIIAAIIKAIGKELSSETLYVEDVQDFVQNLVEYNSRKNPLARENHRTCFISP